MKKLYEYTLDEIHTICHGMPISQRLDFVITTLEVAKVTPYYLQNYITVGFDENFVTGFQDHINSYGEDSGHLGMKGAKACEKKLHEFFIAKQLSYRSRLELIMD